MNQRLQTILVSLLTPGLGYFQTGNKKAFLKTIGLFFGVIIMSVILRLFTSFEGIVTILGLLIGIYIFSAAKSTVKTKQAYSKIQTSAVLPVCITITFILVTGLSFASRRTVMGFDIMKMGVAVMRPTVLQGERFLVNTWAYKQAEPERGDIIAHSFVGQKGIYLNRVIAIENDKIQIENGIVLLNGEILNEPYVLSANVKEPQSKNMPVIIIPKGHYFVMGDNRDASFGDSRFSGTITIDNITGKATDVITSQYKSRIGKTLK